MKKRMLSFLLVLLMLGVLFVPKEAFAQDINGWSFLDSNASYDEVTEKVEAYINILGIGSAGDYKVYWNKGLGYNDLIQLTRNGQLHETVKSTACVGSKTAGTHSRYSTVNGEKGCTSNLMQNSSGVNQGVSGGTSQCFGFADYMGFVVFGDLAVGNSNAFSKITTFESNFKFHPGDIIRYTYTKSNGKTSEHSVFVYKVEDDVLYYIECNWGSNCVLTYGRHESSSTMLSRDFTLWRILSLSANPSPVQQCLDQCTSYPCNYTLTVIIEGNMKNMPASVVNNPQSETVEGLTNGNTYLSSTYWVNPLGETWYETTSTTGQRGFIYYGDVSVSETPSTLKVTGHESGTPSGMLTLGSNFGLRGTISSNYTITYVEAHIFNSDGSNAVSPYYQTSWNKTSYNIQTDGINNFFSFRSLPANNDANPKYRYVVAASDASANIMWILIDSWFTVGSGATEQKSVFDLNGWLNGNLSWGSIEGYGTVDVYINGRLVESNVNDFCAEYPVGTSYEIKNIRALDGCQYDGVHSGSLTGTIGTDRVEVYLAFSKLSYLNLDGLLDGTANDGLGAYGVADVYINGNLVADGWNDYWEAWPAGTTYEIKNIRANEGYQYNGVHSGSLSGTIGTERVNVVLSFSSLVNLNLDGFLDGSKYDSLNDYGTADVYINGSLVASGCSDYWEAWPTGTTYEIKNIIANPGYHYNGVYSGSLSGIIGTERVNVVLSFGTNTSGLCGDNVSWRLEDDKLFIEGTGSMYDYFYYPPWYSSRLSIKEAIISNGVTTIGNDTCHYCTNLVNVSIPDSVTSIGVSAFSECSSLTSIKIPENVTRIGDYAFYYCESLTGIQIPNNVSYIGEWAFIGCTNLKSVTIPDTVSYIGTYAFCGCDSLTSVVIPSLVTSIGEYTFSGCSSMESVTIPNNVRSIDHHAFKSCSCLRDVYYMGTEAQWKLIAISSDNESLTSATIHYLTEPDFILPASLIKIEDEAFAGGAFTYAKLPENAVSIGYRAFADCPNLAYIYIPALTTQIDAQAFGNMQGLTILGKTGSTAETYAKNHNYTFIAVP